MVDFVFFLHLARWIFFFSSSSPSQPCPSNHPPSTPLLPHALNTDSQSVSYKWLARKHGIPADAAKQLLFSFVEAEQQGGGPGVAATYLVAGWSSSSSETTGNGSSSNSNDKEHVVMLVPARDLERARGLLDPLTALHVFAVAPAQPRDAAAE